MTEKIELEMKWGSFSGSLRATQSANVTFCNNACIILCQSKYIHCKVIVLLCGINIKWKWQVAKISNTQTIWFWTCCTRRKRDEMRVHDFFSKPLSLTVKLAVSKNYAAVCAESCHCRLPCNHNVYGDTNIFLCFVSLLLSLEYHSQFLP